MTKATATRRRTRASNEKTAAAPPNEKALAAVDQFLDLILAPEQATESTSAIRYRTIRKRVSSLKASPENEAIYRAIDEDDPEIIKLGESIKQHGLLDPLVITEDSYVVSGNRRLAACRRIEQVVVPCRTLPFRRDQLTKEQYIAVLREYNRNRSKNAAEEAREAIIDIDPVKAHENLKRIRDKSIWGYKKRGLNILNIEGSKIRHGISSQKADHVKYIKQVVFHDRRKYWPLSVRGTHYPLLNYTFYRNIPREIPYENDEGSYNATSDLITRLRLCGELPWEAFDDFTRPLHEFRPFSDVRHFVTQQLNRLFAGYWRNLLQTQPNHIEAVCEKNTIYHMVLSVTKKYQIPTSSGRGFNSIDPWYDLAERYRNSGKERLIVIVESDWDPEGEQIPQVAGRTLMELGIREDELDIIKSGVTREQIQKYNLPSQNFAKETSSNYDWFVERNGGRNEVYELEALPPEDMLRDLEAVITGALDMDLFNAEAMKEQEEAVELEAIRNTAAKLLKGIAG